MGRNVVVVASVGLLSAVLLAADSASSATKFSWQEPHAKVSPTGDLEWAPRPFEFKPNPNSPLRYIDFDTGDDANDGTAKDRPWKHHPWDRNATGVAKAAKGSLTYVFKQGVIYRGELIGAESGTPEAPISLTRDPSWGEGPAIICGSEVVTDWKQGAEDPRLPDRAKVWYVDLNWLPRCLWSVTADGKITRIPLARTPNWTISNPDDIKSEWWSWKNPEKPFDNYATVNGERRHLAFDAEHINTAKPQDYYDGAIVWTTKGWVMGSPFPARVIAADREAGSLTFTGQWGGGPAYKIIRGCQYYLEDKPHYLDSPGEFWFDRKGEGGRLYLRLPADQDPNSARIEVAKRIHGVDSRGMSHVHVSGLTFRFTNVYWNLVAAPYWVTKESIDVEPGCVRLLGSGKDISVTKCTFEYVHRGVRIKAHGPNDAIDQVVVNDNVFIENDAGAIELADMSTWGDKGDPMGRLYDVRVMRNRFENIGLRPDLFGQGGAVVVNYAETAEIAGNIFYRVASQGIDVHGAKNSDAASDRPFTRILIHHNKAVDTLINNDDFGGIETWQGGPAYVYNNISGNPGGYRSWDHALSPNTEDRFGHAYYLDGAFKNYYFNNIAWGKSKGPSGKLANTAALQQIISYENTFFNNTFYNFVRGSRRQAPQAGRNRFFANIWQSMGERVFRDADPANTEAAGNEPDAGARRDEYAIETNAYSRNVFFDTGHTFAVFEPSGRWHKTLEAFQSALASYKPMAADVGIMAEAPPLPNAEKHDFRPAADSAAKGKGARVFMPWSLYQTVGEWHFTPIPATPTRILDEHWCMSPYYVSRDDYYTQPTYPLTGVNIGLSDFAAGPLENWTSGSLRFDGKRQYAVLTNEVINKAVRYKSTFSTPAWATVVHPKAMKPGTPAEVQITLREPKEGMKIAADLHFSKKDGSFGGFNVWGGGGREVKGPGPYTFTFTPQDNPDLGNFVVTVFLSPTGEFADQTQMATTPVAVGDAAGQTATARIGGGSVTEERAVTGSDLSNPQIHNHSFILEAYFSAAPGGSTATILRKMSDAAGFALELNATGNVVLTTKSGGTGTKLTSVSAINDGKWHHVLAECDRAAGTFTLYIDGKQDVTGRGIGADVSLANDADLYVAGTPQGENLAGAIDFLRIARGSLADSKTTIEELYAWQFDGPALRDFTGKQRPADGGYAGAIEAASR